MKIKVCFAVGCVALVSGAFGSEILGSGVACKQPGRYIGWPTLCRLRSGELLAVFSGDRDAHVCPWGKVQMVRSKDDGATWSATETIANTVLDDRDAGIVELSDGTLLLNWFTSTAWIEEAKRHAAAKSKARNVYYCGDMAEFYLRHLEKLPKPIPTDEYLTMRSFDGGKTWNAPVRQIGTRPHNVIQLKDGRLLSVGCCGGEERWFVVEDSSNRGDSWNLLSTVGIADDVRQQIGSCKYTLCEPHAVQLKDGRLLAMVRLQVYRDPKVYPQEGESLVSESSDGGKTWSPLKHSGIDGYPPHLIELSDGRVLCVYGKRVVGKYGEYARISEDGGRTWPQANEILLRSHFNEDLGYPSSAQLADGTVLTLYYQAEKQGELPCLQYTRWRP